MTICPKCNSNQVRIVGEGNGYHAFQCKECDWKFIPDFDRKEYEKSLDWNKIKCKLHPSKNAIMQINPPIGAFQCRECVREAELMRIQNMGVGF